MSEFITIEESSLLPKGTLIWDRSTELEESDVLYSFALEELLCRHTGQGGPPIIHLWRHPRGFVMGLRDSRLPHARDAYHMLEEEGYSVAVRNSGGAAVPLDAEVVNVSLILPKLQRTEIHFRSDFERMAGLINAALGIQGAKADAGEIVGAYCPGDYDLSIGGQKFCGIAQRRQAHAYVVQAFVTAGGSGRERAALARRFYDTASGGLSGTYPNVELDRTASLSELGVLPRQDAAQAFVQATKQAVRSLTAGQHDAETKELWIPDRPQVLEMVRSLRNRYGISN